MKSVLLARNFFFLVIIATILFITNSQAQVSLTRLSQDTILTPINSNNIFLLFFPIPQHDTEVEPSSFSYGSTIVAGFQVAREFDGGGAAIGFATSTDGGTSWTNGYLPGLTYFDDGSNYLTASDASVAYDALHNVWLISSLALVNLVATQDSIVVSRSSDALNWDPPIFLTWRSELSFPDKNWTVCDNTPASPYYGNCYTEWEDTFATAVLMTTSTDGGLTWSPATLTAGKAYGVGGVPLVQPNGTVIVPINDFSGNVIAFTSTNGGQSWNAPVNVSNIISHQEDGGLRSADIISAAMDAQGTIYVVWSDCRFRANCSSNDIVYSTSTDGANWTAVQRIPIDPVTSTDDHFITGLSIAPGTSGLTAQLALVYYYYPRSSCAGHCRLYAGFIQSSTGGATWSKPERLAGPMQLEWLPDTFSGRMVADYTSVAFGGGRWFPIFAVANPPDGRFQQAIYTTATGQDLLTADREVLSAAGDRPVPHAHSDHPQMQGWELEHTSPASMEEPGRPKN